jgi:hypothetical protein
MRNARRHSTDVARRSSRLPFREVRTPLIERFLILGRQPIEINSPTVGLRWKDELV